MTAITSIIVFDHKDFHVMLSVTYPLAIAKFLVQNSIWPLSTILDMLGVTEKPTTVHTCWLSAVNISQDWPRHFKPVYL